MAAERRRAAYELGLGLTEEHTALAESVRAFTERVITADGVRAALAAPAEEKFPWYWPDLSAQDLLGLHVPEEQGGSGGGLLTAAVALEALGRTVAPGPYVPTVLASAVLAAADDKAGIDLLPGLISGGRTGAVALGPAVAGAAGITGRRDADGLVLDGVLDAVLGAAAADVVVVPVTVVEGDGGEGAGGATEAVWVAVDGPQLRRTEQDGVDLLRRSARIEATGLRVPESRVLAALESDRVRAIATVLLGAEALGVLSWCVSTAAEYAKTREQFGRPIGGFQAVKHACARMGIALEKARATLWDAARALDADDGDAALAADIAATVVPDAAVEVAQQCIQVHGGIGFTWEHDAHLYYRRALAIRAVLGTREERAGRVAAAALAGARRECALELPEEADALRGPIADALRDIAAIADEDEQLVALGDGGWVQPHLPRPYGRGAGPLEQIVISEDIGTAGIAMPQLLMGGWAVQAIVAHGTERQKRELVVPTLRGEVVWCQLFSEPGAGSDLASLTTRAVRVDGGWEITGQKIWTTVAQLAQWAMLIARTNPEAPKHEGITYFVLDMSAPGVTVRPLREMTGSALFNEVFLDRVFIPDSDVVGAVDDGWHVARTTLAGERVALSQKMEAYATDADLLAFARGRALTPVGRHQLGELVAESQAVDLLGVRTVLGQLSGADVSTTSSVGKLLAMGLGQSIAEYVVAQLGPAGAVAVPGMPSDKAIEQLIAGRATTIYGGTTEVQLNVIAERMLGLPRD
ncbi:acyl-CoA dehydrogenase [Tomitella cavernea]|uniref:Acyl-CoA dehydrogenase n=1 Tax=Tomitella cavernea TaxID=1387982 RepID=A0ABP9CAJ0_9ACTN|nr:acyl-CoA dehydrogenase [Tomitella cavernea]